VKRPVDEGVSSSSSRSDEALARALSLASEGGGNDDDGDEDLAAAIAMSMAETNTSQSEAAGATTPVAATTEGAAAASATPPSPASAPALVLPPLPGPDEPGPLARVQLQGGGLTGKLVRKFRASDEAISVFAWADACLAEVANNSSNSSAAAKLALATGYSLGFGRETLTRADLAEALSPSDDGDASERKTMASMGLTPSAALTVRPR